MTSAEGLLPRRQWLTAMAWSIGRVATAATPADGAAAPGTAPPVVTLGMGTYGMPGMPVADAVALVAATGFDTLELAVLPEWPSAPERLGPAERRDLRQRLTDTGLVLTALMEHVTPAADAAGHAQGLERLRRAAALAQDLAPAAPPLIQTVLGGGRWEAVRGLFVERLADWCAVADAAAVRIAVKPHRAGAMSTPEEGRWLLTQLGDPPRLGLVFDASHVVFRGLDLAAALATAAPRLFHVAAKDAVETTAGVGFALPGTAGTIDHAALLRQLVAVGYRGDVSCEVSSQVSKRPGYDPAAAVRMCHARMAAAFAAAGIARGR